MESFHDIVSMCACTGAAAVALSFLRLVPGRQLATSNAPHQSFARSCAAAGPARRVLLPNPLGLPLGAILYLFKTIIIAIQR